MRRPATLVTTVRYSEWYVRIRGVSFESPSVLRKRFVAIKKKKQSNTKISRVLLFGVWECFFAMYTHTLQLNSNETRLRGVSFNIVFRSSPSAKCKIIIIISARVCGQVRFRSRTPIVFQAVEIRRKQHDTHTTYDGRTRTRFLLESRPAA